MKEIYIRNIIFGIVDSLASTVGFLAGISAGGVGASTIVLTGVVYAFVEAFSMAVGSFLSEESAEEYKAKGYIHERKPLVGGVVMFFSSALAAFIPIAPYMIFEPSGAVWISVVLSAASLFIAGATIGKISKISVARQGLKMAFLGIFATILGIAVGKIIKIG